MASKTTAHANLSCAQANGRLTRKNPGAEQNCWSSRQHSAVSRPSVVEAYVLNIWEGMCSGSAAWHWDSCSRFAMQLWVCQPNVVWHNSLAFLQQIKADSRKGIIVLCQITRPSRLS